MPYQEGSIVVPAAYFPPELLNTLDGKLPKDFTFYLVNNSMSTDSFSKSWLEHKTGGMSLRIQLCGQNDVEGRSQICEAYGAKW